MENNPLEKIFLPSRGSKERFKTKLDLEIKAEHTDAIHLRWISAGLAAAIGFLVLAPSIPTPPSLNEAAFLLEAKPQSRAASSQISDQAAEISSGAPGIRLYWIVR